MANNCTFAFLLSVYKNDKSYALEQCLKSINDQTVSADETIVVVEGAIDETLINTLDSFLGKIDCLRIIRLPDQNGPLGFGLPSCLNYGLAVSKCDYIVRIDSDDINKKNRIEVTKRHIIGNPKIKLFGSNVDEFDEKLINKLKRRIVPETHNEIMNYSKFRNPFNGPAVAFDRLLAIQLGGYPQVASNEDWCLWAAFLKYNHLTHNEQESLVSMRAGLGLIKRRSSFRYIRGEWQSLRYLYGIGFFNLYLYIFNLITRTLIRIMPLKFVSVIYNFLLRK